LSISQDPVTEFANTTTFIAFELVYYNAVTLIIDLIGALFGPYAAMFVMILT